MVNYDLPWNPNRLEQRFGRPTPRQQLAQAREALGGRAFDVLGELFEGPCLAAGEQRGGDLVAALPRSEPLD